MSDDISSLKDQFLIAMPRMSDPNFFHSVTYICEHNDEGAMGIVINHPMDINVFDLLDHMEIQVNMSLPDDSPVFAGGPVQQERGFVIHRPWGEWQSTLEASKEICITTSRDILEAIAEGNGPDEKLIALGYAGWDKGQLEDEIVNNVWLSCKADPEILFNTPHAERWQKAASLLGVDLDKLSDDVGHA